MDPNGVRVNDPDEAQSVPSYSEDSQEDFTGPECLVNYGAIHDEALDDDYEAESAMLIEGRERGPAVNVVQGSERDHTQ